MRSLSRTIIPAILLALFFLTPVAQAVEEGDPAPDFTLTDTEGVEHSLSQYLGTVVFIEFFGYS